jgi:hypothetical protein
LLHVVLLMMEKPRFGRVFFGALTLHYCGSVTAA